MNWDAWDYSAAILLIGGLALSFFIAARFIRHQYLRRVAMLGLPAIFALIWIELAVGVFR